MTCNKGAEHNKILTYQAMSLLLNLMSLKLTSCGLPRHLDLQSFANALCPVCAVTTLVQC